MSQCGACALFAPQGHGMVARGRPGGPCPWKIVSYSERPERAPGGGHMPSTHVSLHFHIVFSTKNREPLIAAEWEPRLYAYLGGCIRTLGGVALEINGMPDHVHLLIGLKATHRPSDVLRDTKTPSSGWVHDVIKFRKFQWQEGYGAFTVGPSTIESVRRYIRRQKIHHRKKSFQEEYVELLEMSGVKYDPQFLW